MPPPKSFAKAAVHPLRAMTLSVLAERTASPKEIAELLDEPLRSVSHQVAELRKAKLIELVTEEKRGGVTEHFYRGTIAEDDDLGDLDMFSRQVLTKVMVQLIIGDLTRAVQARSLERRPDTQLNRLALELDQQGWEELKDCFARALVEAVEIKERTEERIGDRDPPGTRVVATLGLFDAAGS